MTEKNGTAVLGVFFSEDWKIRPDLFSAEYHGTARAR
jgi:hypothetical protein